MLHSSYRFPLALENQCYPLSFYIDSQSMHKVQLLAIDQKFHISQLSPYKITMRQFQENNKNSMVAQILHVLFLPLHASASYHTTIFVFFFETDTAIFR
jgi:hypothetical protein